MYLFSKKIQCKKCGGNFKGITERGKRKYICSRYANYRDCVRRKIDEQELIELAQNHYEISLIKSGVGLGGSRKRGRPKKEEELERSRKINLSLIQSYVEKILVDPDLDVIEIFYQDKTITYLSPNRITF